MSVLSVELPGTTLVVTDGSPSSNAGHLFCLIGNMTALVGAAFVSLALEHQLCG